MQVSTWRVGEGGCRADGVDVTEIARKDGWRYVDNKKDFDALGSKVELPLLGLFAHGDIPYEIDRLHQEDVYPSLEEMTKTALRTLADATKDSEKGFFIMIEGSRIDHAGHANDPAAQVHEVQSYNRAMAAVLDFIKQEETPTLMISTSDHETGGLAVARQLHREYPPYVWYPGVLAKRQPLRKLRCPRIPQPLAGVLNRAGPKSRRPPSLSLVSDFPCSWHFRLCLGRNRRSY